VPDRPPHAAYAGILTAFVGGLAAAGALAARRGAAEKPVRATDLALLGLATFKASRTVTKDRVTSFVREPFVEGEAAAGADEPVHTGDLRQAVGELVTCTRCVGTWVGAGLTCTSLLAPRTGRVLTSVLAAAAVNDWLQAGFAALAARADDAG